MPSTRPQLRLTSNKTFFIFDTHPIQYRSPIFRALHARMPGAKVFFFSRNFDGKKWWFHEVGKIPKQDWAVDLTSGFPNEVLPLKGLWKFYRTTFHLLKSHKPDAVLIYGYYLPQHWILWWLCRNLGLPLLFVGETFVRAGSRSRRAIKTALQPVFFRGIQQFVSIGKRTKDFYLSFGTAESKITEAKYCIDTHFFELSAKKSTEVRNGVRRSLEIPKDAFVILFVGRLFERKRPWDMIAIHKNFSQASKVYTLVAGNGPLEHELKKETLNVPRFLLLGFQNQMQTRDLYHAADVLVVPSEYETWGLVINEAFACGVPAIVTSDCGASQDLVLDGKTGFVYPVGDISAATQHVRWCLENPTEFSVMSQAAKTKVSLEYRVDQFADALVQAVEAATSRS